MKHSGYFKYDVFICHAYEDQISLVDELYNGLRSAGLKVWYSRVDMVPGESLNETIIHKIIPETKYGVAIISNNIFKAVWVRKELNAMHALRDVRGYDMIIPVWHGVNENEVQVELPYLVDNFALKTSTKPDILIAGLVQAIKKPIPLRKEKGDEILTNRISRVIKYIINKVWVLAIAIALFSLVLFVLKSIQEYPSDELIVKNVNIRIKQLEDKAESDYNSVLNIHNLRSVLFEETQALYTSYISPNNSCGRNEYLLYSDQPTIKGRKNLEEKGIDTKGFYSSFGMTNFDSFVTEDTVKHLVHIVLINKNQIGYDILGKQTISPGEAMVRVRHSDPIRYVYIELDRGNNNERCVSATRKFFAINNYAQYVFERRGESWVFSGVK